MKTSMKYFGLVVGP